MEIRIDNFRECMKLAQRAVFIGLSVAALVQYISANDQGDYFPNIPLFSVEFDSLGSLQVALLILYIGAGLLACFSTSRAVSILSSIEDSLLRAEVSKYPSIIASSIFYRAMLSGALLGSGILLIMDMMPYNDWREYLIYFVISLPFFAALSFGSLINRYEKPQKISG